MVDLLAGQVQVMFEGITSSIGYGRDGKLRVLGVTSETRTERFTRHPAHCPIRARL